MNAQYKVEWISPAGASLLVLLWLGTVALNSTSSATPFELFVTQSPPGPQNQDPASWSGVLQYHATNNSGPLVAGGGIDKTNLADPAGLAFRQSTRELFVGNRHGNNNPSSISRFIFDGASRRLTPNGKITGQWSLWRAPDSVQSHNGGDVCRQRELRGLSVHVRHHRKPDSQWHD